MEQTVLAADQPGTTISGCVAIRQDETIETAELFWVQRLVQASYIISKSQRPVRLKFSLDRDTRCAECARFTHPDIRVVDDPQQLQAALSKNLILFVVADIGQRWYLQGLAQAGIEAWCVSPPCQPFSTASSGPGQALLHVKHPHFGFLKSLWESLGYKMIWQGCFDLRDFAPSSRMRFLAILVREDVVPATPIPACRPTLGPRPSLRSFSCLVDLPEFLKKPRGLSADLLSFYMRPDLLPVSSRTGRAQTAEKYRCRAPEDSLGCMMASYHFQHELPPECLLACHAGGAPG